MIGIEMQGNLTHHRLDTVIGMIGGSSSGSAPNRSIESFQATGGTEVFELPVRMSALDEEVGDGLPEISAEGLNSSRLSEPIVTADLEVATQYRMPAFGLVDGQDIKAAQVERPADIMEKVIVVNTLRFELVKTT